ncbi:MAG: hypothetical protein FJ009_09040 [Chloroflexi bacterium]|nr:hypothetical protein [Chloroflexota bacterium]
MAAIQIMPQLVPALERMQGETFDEKLARLVANELRRYLEEIERESLEYEIKYGVNHDQFTAKLERGELGNPYGYELEQDAMRWEDLLDEKKMWLEQLRQVGGLVK